MEAAGLITLADKGYLGSVHATIPYIHLQVSSALANCMLVEVEVKCETTFHSPCRATTLQFLLLSNVEKHPARPFGQKP